MDIGGPAPDGFWIFAGGQRLLNTVLFIPAAALLVLGASRWWIGWVLVPLGLVGLAAYSVVIELIQLELARIDRACDLTDVVDNVSGALIGVAVGVVLMVLFRPWRIFRLLPDWRTIRFWFRRQRRDNRDDTLLLSLIDEFASEDLHFASALDLCPELLVHNGVLTRRGLSSR